MKKNKSEITIVGGGPVGLFLGICLSKQGIDCTILEKRAEPVQDSRSLGIHPVSLELFEKTGLIINEVILNMYRDAFIGYDKGKIAIAVKKDGGDKVLISISDNGNGISEYLDGTVAGNLASIVIQTLGDKLNAESRQHMNEDGGTTFTLIFSRETTNLPSI